MAEPERLVTEPEGKLEEQQLIEIKRLSAYSGPYSSVVLSLTTQEQSQVHDMERRELKRT